MVWMNAPIILNHCGDIGIFGTWLDRGGPVTGSGGKLPSRDELTVLGVGPTPLCPCIMPQLPPCYEES